MLDGRGTVNRATSLVSRVALSLEKHDIARHGMLDGSVARHNLLVLQLEVARMVVNGEQCTIDIKLVDPLGTRSRVRADRSDLLEVAMEAFALVGRDDLELSHRAVSVRELPKSLVNQRSVARQTLGRARWVFAEKGANDRSSVCRRLASQDPTGLRGNMGGELP